MSSPDLISKSFSVTNSVSGFKRGLVEILGMSALPDSVPKLVPKIPEKGQKRLDLISKSASVTNSVSGFKSGLVEIFGITRFSYQIGAKNM